MFTTRKSIVRPTHPTFKLSEQVVAVILRLRILSANDTALAQLMDELAADLPMPLLEQEIGKPDDPSTAHPA